MRLFPSSTDGEFFINAMSGEGENLFNSLTVFNYYPPSYTSCRTVVCSRRNTASSTRPRC